MKNLLLAIFGVCMCNTVWSQSGPIKVTIGSGLTATMTGSIQVTMSNSTGSPSFTNNGTFRDHGGTFNDLCGLTFAGSGISNLYNLDVTHASGTTLFSSLVSVYNTATLAQGNLDANNNLYIRSDAGNATMVNNGSLTNNVQGLIAKASATTGACPSYTSNLSLNISGTHMRYQWQSSATGGAPWSDVGGATNASYAATVTQTIYYRCNLSTDNTAFAASTPSVLLNFTGTYPTITPGANPAVLQGTTSASLPYSTTGTPDHYNITYDAAAHTAGFADVTFATLPITSPLPLTIPAAPVPAVYNGTVTVTNGCVSTGAPFTVTIIAPLTFTGGSPQTFALCESSPATSINTLLTINDPTGITETWTVVSGPSNGSLGGFPYATAATGGDVTPTGLTYTPAPGYSGSDAFTIQVSNGTQTAITTINVTVNPLPTANAGSAVAAICQSGTTAALGGSFNGGATAAVWSDGGAGGSFANNSGSTPGTATYTASSSSSSPVILTLLTSGGSCGVTSVNKSLTVNPNPTVNAGGVLSAICQGMTTASLGGSFGGGATSATWNDGGAGGSFFNNSGTTPGTAIYVASLSSGPSVTLTLVTSGGSCGTTSAGKSLTVNPNPTVNAGPALSDICQGATTAALDGSYGGGATSAVWNDGGAGGTFTNNSGTTPGTTTYTASASSGSSVILNLVTSGGSCSTVLAGKILTVNPVPTVNAGGVVSAVCQGGTTAALGGTFGGGATAAVWNDGGAGGTFAGNSGATPATATYTASANSSTPVTLTLVTSGGACGIASAGKSLIVNPNPTIDNISNNGPVCAGANLNFISAASGGTGTLGYAWSGPGAYSATVQNPAITAVPVMASGTYTLTVRDANSCSAKATTTAVVHATPVIAAVGSNAPVCEENALTLSSLVTGGTGVYTYEWNGPNGFTSADEDPTVTASATTAANGTYTLVVTDANTCVATGINTTNVTVHPIQPISGPASVLFGQTITLSDPVAGGSWSTPTPWRTSVTVNGVVKGVSAGTSIISYTTVHGCIATYTVSVISGVNACVGQTIALSDNGAAGGTWSSGSASIAIIGATTGILTGVSAGKVVISYRTSPTSVVTTTTVTVNPLMPTTVSSANVCQGQAIVLTNPTPGGGSWYSGNTSAAVVSSTGVVSGLLGGVVDVYFTPIAGCTAVKTVTVTPVAPITGIINVCVGGTTSLSNSIPGGVWSSSSGALATTSPGGTVGGVAAGKPVIFYVWPNGCWTSTTVTVNPLVQTNTSTTGIVCQGYAIPYTNATVGGGVWSSGNTAIATVNSSGIVTGTGVGVTNISFNTAAGCLATKPVTVNGRPAISGITAVCMGQTTTLSSNFNGGTWSSSSGSLASVSATGVVKGIATGSPRISYLLSTGCYSTATVTVHTLNATTGGTAGMCQNSSMTLSNTTPFGGVWTSSNTSTATVNSSGTVRGAGVGSTTILFTSSVGSCVATRTITVNACREAETEETTTTRSNTPLATEVQLAPNPNSGNFTLTGTIPSLNANEVAIDIVNILGQVIYRKTLHVVNGNINEQIQLDNALAAGQYMLNVRSSTELKIIRFVIAR